MDSKLKNIDKITPEKLKNANHLADAMHYWRTMIGAAMYNSYQHAELKAYACECKHCNLTSYTSFKQLNCRYCGSNDPSVFECRELK